jgi:uncharacterized RDD family membrane protein YckC
VTDPTRPAPPYGAGPPVPGYGYNVQPAYAPPIAPTGQPLAEFADRLLAFLVDVAIMAAISVVLFIPMAIGIFAIFAATAQADEETGATGVGGPFAVFGIVILYWALLIAINYVYQVEMMYKRGQTIGKRVLKVQVIPLRPGEQLTRGIAAKRWLANVVAGTIVPFWHWIDGLWQLWDTPYRQCLHDKFAETVVVKLPT